MLYEVITKVVREDLEGNELLLYYLQGGETCASTLSCCLNKIVSEIRATVLEDVTVIMVPIQFMDDWFRITSYNVCYTKLLRPYLRQ